jgi:spore maturation protein CgeB
VVGSLYPPEIRWPPNVATHWHLEPAEHPAFYSANRLTLNVTRQAMRSWGYTPSGRLFEAASCGTPVLTDAWPGIEDFFQPGQEILVAETPEEAEAALDLDPAQRARELIAACESAAC